MFSTLVKRPLPTSDELEVRRQAWKGKNNPFALKRLKRDDDASLN